MDWSLETTVGITPGKVKEILEVASLHGEPRKIRRVLDRIGKSSEVKFKTELSGGHVGGKATIVAQVKDRQRRYLLKLVDSKDAIAHMAALLVAVKDMEFPVRINGGAEEPAGSAFCRLYPEIMEKLEAERRKWRRMGPFLMSDSSPASPKS